MHEYSERRSFWDYSIPFLKHNEKDDSDDDTEEDESDPFADPEKRETKPDGPKETKPDEPDEEKSERGGKIPNPDDQDKARRRHATK